MSSESGKENALNVVFGTGALEQAVMRELLRQGKQVRVITDEEAKTPRLPVGVDLKAVTADKVNSNVKGATVVYDCATWNASGRAQPYLTMQKRIISAAAAAGAKLVSAEGVHSYGEISGRMTENLAPMAAAGKGKLQSRLTTALMDAYTSGKVRAVIGRAPDIYGPGLTNEGIYGAYIFYPVLEGKRVTVYGPLDNAHSFLFLDDFAKGLVFLAEREEATGQIWHLPCPPGITQRELLAIIFEEAGRKPDIAERFSDSARLWGLFSPAVRAIADVPYEWDKPYLYDHSKFDSTFGAEALPLTPHREGVKLALEWYRRHPKD